MPRADNRIPSIHRPLVAGATAMLFAALVAGCGDSGSGTPQASPPAAATAPRADHVVIVIEENREFSEIVDNPDAAYLNQLATQGALFTDFHAVTHPSEPNYLALFSGSTQGLTDDSCPHRYTSPNLASELDAGGLSFAIYSESLPQAGFTGCISGAYARKHNPAVNWQGVNIRPDQNLPFTAFPGDFQQLPTVSFVVPNLNNDMHDGTIADADRWLEQHLSNYVQWTYDHNSLLIVTWDENDGEPGNHIPTMLVGPMVKAGRYDERIDLYALLRTLEAMYGLPALGESAAVAPVTDVWQANNGG